MKEELYSFISHPTKSTIMYTKYMPLWAAADETGFKKLIKKGEMLHFHYPVCLFR